MTSVIEPIVETIQTDVAGLYFRSVLLTHEGMSIPQHIHGYDHATLVGSGRARLFRNNQEIGTYSAGQAVEILAGHSHTFVALEPMTRLCCVHHTESAIAAQMKE